MDYNVFMPTKEWSDANPEKMKEYRRKYYHSHRESEIKRVKDRVVNLLQWLNDYKSNLTCKECGFSHPAALDFHHRNAEEKEANIAEAIRTKGWSKEKIIQEIEKCDVLCSNCHRIHHYQMGLRSQGETAASKTAN